MSTSGLYAAVGPDTRRDERQWFSLKDIPVTLLGEPGRWFAVEHDGGAVMVRPKEPLPRRCTIRPVALFEQHGRFPNANTVMGRIVFPHGATEGQRYQAYSHDPRRKLRELFLPVEAMPDDDWLTSAARWRNFEAIAKRLCLAAEVPWKGLSPSDVDDLVRFVPFPEVLEGCVLHALTQWAQGRGEAVIEVGSFRGRSISMLALALRGVGSESPVISVDPHLEEPHNPAHVRLSLAELGEEKRLVQFAYSSDRAWRFLRPGSASLVFIDGDHSYRQVVSDFNNYRDLLAPGGCMVFHDYCYGNHNGLPEANPEVRPAVDEQVMPKSEFRPLLLAHTLFAFVKTA